MAIDYTIGYDCVPKQTFSAEGILERLKGKERADSVIQLFRRSGDERPPSEMGFELTRSTPEGEEETRVIVVQSMLDRYEELSAVEHHCAACPANRTGLPFGCNGFIQYPISQAAEQWLLDRLPTPDDTLVWSLLRLGVKEFKYDGGSVEPLRAADGTYFEVQTPDRRLLGELRFDANQLFEMIFAVGSIQPNHGALLLLFVNAIPRTLEADEIMNITPAPPDVETKHPFLLKPEQNDDHTISEMKAFFRALYMAWKLNVPMHVDA